MIEYLLLASLFILIFSVIIVLLKRRNKNKQYNEVVNFFKQQMYVECLRRGMTDKEAKEFVKKNS